MKRLLLLLIILSLCFIHTTVYVSAQTELTFYTSNADAYVSYSDETYVDCNSAPTGTGISTTGTDIYIGQEVQAGPYYIIYRAAFYFDTSTLPDTAIIESATLTLFGWNGFIEDNFNVVIQNGQPTYPHNPLELADFNRTYYSGNGGSLSTASWVDDDFNDIELNSDGLSWINVAGTTKLMLRSDTDINVEEPTGDELLDVCSVEGQLDTELASLTIVYSLPTPISDFVGSSASVLATTFLVFIVVIGVSLAANPNKNEEVIKQTLSLLIALVVLCVSLVIFTDWGV